MADVTGAIRRALAEQEAKTPSEATVYSIGQTTVDVRVRGSATLIRNVPVAGNINGLRKGQVVSLKWEGGKPIAIAINNTGVVPLSVMIDADNDTIENSPVGIRIKQGGVRPWHLNFRPSIEGHTHLDMLQIAGWKIDEDGSISNRDVYLHTTGQISLGQSPNVLKLDATHDTHRIWVGATTPDLADFSVDKYGKVTARSGEIAGWDILSDRLSKNGAELKASGELVLGEGAQSAILSGSNLNGWRLWVGAEVPEEAPFRVNSNGEAWINVAHIGGDMQSANYQSNTQGWRLSMDGDADLNNVNIRGTMQSMVFAQATTSVMASRTIVTDGAALISDVGIDDEYIYVDAGAFAEGDYLQLQAAIDRKEWMKAMSDPVAVEGGYRYAVGRNVDGYGASTFFAGEVVFSKGSSNYPADATMIGEYMEMGSYGMALIPAATPTFGGFLTLEGGRQYGPYFAVAKRYGPVYNQISDVLRMGRLDGFLNITGNRYGFATGDVNRSMVYTNDDGLKIVTAGGNTLIDDTGITTKAFGVLPSSPAPSYREGVGVIYVDDASMQLKVRYKNATYTKEATIVDMLGGSLTSMITAAGDFLVGSAPGVLIKKTLAETRTLLGLAALAYRNTVATAHIDDAAVTFAKMLNVNTDTLIGRAAAGVGPPTEIGITAWGRYFIAQASQYAQRLAMGLSEAATLPVGTTASTLMAGNDSRVTGLPPTYSGTYTPTFVKVANLATVVVSGTWRYMRIGQVVHVSGRYTADPTAAGTCTFQASLPFASAFANAAGCSGVSKAELVSDAAAIYSDNPSDTVEFNWVAADIANRNWDCVFSYTVF